MIKKIVIFLLKAILGLAMLLMSALYAGKFIRYLIYGFSYLFSIVCSFILDVINAIGNGIYSAVVAVWYRYRGDASLYDWIGLLFSVVIVLYLFIHPKGVVDKIWAMLKAIKYIWRCCGRLCWMMSEPFRSVIMKYAKMHTATSVLCRWLVAKQRERRHGWDFNIRMLMPIDTARNLDCYNSMLTEALRNKKIKNIAITGRYGAGKSTFLQTYFNGYTVLWVSLAAFIGQLEAGRRIDANNSQSKGFTAGSDDDDIMTKLEWSILQQVIYSAHGEHLPFSRFARIVHSGIYKSIVFGLFITFLILCSIAFLQPDVFFRHYNTLSEFSKLWLHLIALIAAVCIFMPLVFACLHRWFVRHSPCVKVETPAFGVDISKGDKLSVFNRALDELIYFFERLHYDAVVFEDIDRVDRPILFTKLREINHILNHTKQIPESKKPIRFIYAIRDDLFAYAERVKFFDFIIPIFPEFNAEKSNGFILEDVKKILGISFMTSGGWESFIRLFSYYISDRRLWNNIYNEFSLAHHSTSAHLDRKKMLAMILFKNLFPKDYDLAHSRLGLLPYLLGFDDGRARNWRALRNLELIGRARSLLDEKESLKGAETNKNKAKELESGIAEIHNELARVRKFTIKDLIECGDLTYDGYVAAVDLVYKERGESCNSDGDTRWMLLYRLLEKGMIDEQYEDYLTNTPDGAISAKDFVFMQTLMCNGDVANFDVDRASQIIDQLNQNVFRTRLIQNVKFASRFLELSMDDIHDEGLKQKFANFVCRNFLEPNNETLRFLGDLLSSAKILTYRDRWLTVIHKHSPRFLERALAKLDIKSKVSFCGYIIGFLERNTFPGKNNDFAALTKLVVDDLPTELNLNEVVECSGLNANDFCCFLDDYGINFESASFVELKDVELRHMILRRGLYKPTGAIILSVLKHKGLLDTEHETRSPLQAINDLADPILKTKVENDIVSILENEYQIILEGKKGSESENVLLGLMKDERIAIETKAKVLKLQTRANVTSVNELKGEVVDLIIGLDMLVSTWESVINAFKKIGYSDNLRGFVVRHAKDLTKESFNYSGEVAMQCVNEILRDTQMSDNIVFRLAQSINRESRYWYSTVDFPPGRLSVLCKCKLIRFSAEGYEQLQRRGDGSHLILARHNIKHFLDAFKDSWISEHDAISLLSSESEQVAGVGVLLLRKAINLIKGSVEVRKLLAAQVRIRDFEAKSRFTKEMMIELVDYLESPTCRVYTLLMMGKMSAYEMWGHLRLFPGGVSDDGLVSMQISIKVADKFKKALDDMGFVTKLIPAKRMPRLLIGQSGMSIR